MSENGNGTAALKKPGRTQMVAVEDIKVSRGRRDPGDVTGLIDSIKELTLLNPITLAAMPAGGKPTDKPFVLIAGGRRLKAYKTMGLETIPAVVKPMTGVQAELAEIDENLMRLELTRLERAEQTARRKELYEMLHPETIRRGRGNTKEKQKKRRKAAAEAGLAASEALPESPPKKKARPFAVDTASKTGRDPSSVNRDAVIGERLTQEVRDFIRREPLADMKEDLHKLSRVPADKQMDVARKVVGGHCNTVAQAIRAVEREAKAAERAARAAAAPAPEADAPARFRLDAFDCLAPEALASVEAGTVRMAFADPPYNLGVDYGEGKKADLRPPEVYLAWCRTWMQAVERTLTRDGSFWVLISDEWAAEYKQALSEIMAVRQWIVWYESFGVNCVNKFNRCHRHLFWGVKDPKRFVFNDEAFRRPSDRAEKYDDARADPAGKLWDSVWGIKPAIPRLVENAKERLSEFPTQLPLKLLAPIVAGASDPGDLILDPFTGSGTTGEAALAAGRRFVGFEKSAKSAALAKQRLEAVVAP